MVNQQARSQLHQKQGQAVQLKAQPTLANQVQLLQQQAKNPTLNLRESNDAGSGQNQNTLIRNYQNVNSSQWPTGQNIQSVVDSTKSTVTTQSVSTGAFTRTAGSSLLLVNY